MTVPSPASFMRDFQVAGVAASGAYEPPKADIRAFLTFVQQSITGGSLGGPWKASKAALDADLAYAADSVGFVYDTADIGTYVKSGASGSGSWTKVLDYVPGLQISQATDDGSSTANAYTMDTAPHASASDGVTLVHGIIPVTNTSGTVTITFDGGTALALKTGSDNNPAVGGLVAGMPFIGLVSGSGTEFRLLSDQASSAIQAGAEAALASFNEKYLGAYADDSTANTAAGGTPITGALYWNTTADEMRAWDGAVWQAFAGGLADGTVTNVKVAADAAIDSSKLANTRDGGATTRSVFAILNGRHADPLDYGAIVDDDSAPAHAANAAAWAAMIAAGDYDILLPRGILYFSDDPLLGMPAGLMIIGRGKRWSGVVSPINGSGIIANGNIFADTAMDSSPREFRNFFIRNGSGTKGKLFDFGITTSGGMALAGVLFEDVYLGPATHHIYAQGLGGCAVSWRVNRCTFEGSTSAAVRFGFSSNCCIEQSLFAGNEATCVLLQNDGSHLGLRLLDNTFDTNGGSALVVDGNGNTTHSVDLDRSYFEGNGYAAGAPDIFIGKTNSAVVNLIHLGNATFADNSAAQSVRINWSDTPPASIVGGPGLYMTGGVPLAPNSTAVKLFANGYISSEQVDWEFVSYA